MGPLAKVVIHHHSQFHTLWNSPSRPVPPRSVLSPVMQSVGVLTGSTRASPSVEIGVPQNGLNISNHSVPQFISQVELAKPKVEPADDHLHIPPKEKPKKSI